jgi:hypothetical protein
MANGGYTLKAALDVGRLDGPEWVDQRHSDNAVCERLVGIQ